MRLVTRSTRTTSSQLQFVRHATGYTSAIPGLGGSGMDTPHGTGRHLATPLTNRFYIDTLSTANTGSQRPELGPRTYSGSPEYCARANPVFGNGDPQPKCIMPIISGDYRGNNSLPLRQGTTPTGAYVAFLGQGAPAPGFFFRGTRPTSSSSHVLIMHMNSVMGDDPAGLPGDSRDCLAFGYGAGTADYHVIVYNNFSEGVDECLDQYRPHNLVTWAHNFIGNPLHRSTISHTGDPAGTDHGFLAFMGGDATQPGFFTMFGNFLAHGTGRGPATTATRFCSANNLYYNCGGRPGGGNGQAIDILSQFTTEPMVANIMGNGFIRGPEHTSSIVAVNVRSGVPAGTRGYLSNNAQFGWAPITSQSQLLSAGISGYLQPTLQDAIPGSWGGESGVLRWAVDPHNPTLEEWQAYVGLHNRTCGPMPRHRSLSYGSVQKAFDQALARLVGGSTSFQFADTSEDVGLFTTPTLLINPANPGAHYHAPVPTGDDIDDLLTSGTLLNGDSAAGRTVWEAWFLNQHYYVMNQ